MYYNSPIKQIPVLFFSGGPVVGAFTAVSWDQSLVGELRSCKTHGVAKKKFKKQFTHFFHLPLPYLWQPPIYSLYL